MLIIVLSCVSSKEMNLSFGEESLHNESDDSEVPEYVGQWVIGEEEPCHQPQSSPSWIDESELLWGETRTNGDGQPAGCLALIETEEDWIIAGTTKNINVRWGHLYERDVHDVLLDPASVRLRVADIDGDGQLDAISHSRSLHIGWGFTGNTPLWEEIVPRDRDCQFRDLVIVDVEGDGDLDLIVAGLGGCAEQSWKGAILENLGNRGFSEPKEIPIDDNVWGVLFDSITVDIDGDLDLDIYMCNDFGESIAPNTWLYNDSGSLYLDDNYGSDIVAHCMGASISDVDQNGILDMYVAGNGNQFLLIGDESGWYEAQNSWNMPSFLPLQMPWGSQFIDYNNDGLIDLLISTSDFAQTGNALFPIWMLEHTSMGNFEEVGLHLGFPQEAGGRGVIAHDINWDGVLDFLIADAFGDPWMFMSQGCTEQNWIEVYAPAGSIVEVHAAGKQWKMVASNDPGFAVYKPASVHIGLGDIQYIDRIEIDIPYQGRASLIGPLSTRRRLRVDGL